MTSRACSVDGCERPHHARGLCTPHHKRWLRRGSAETLGTERGAPQQFLEYALTFAGDDCLIWPYSKTTYGYGQINLNNRPQNVARLICQRIYGDAPAGKNDAAHRCGNGRNACINPTHLYWASREENEHDKIGHGTLVWGDNSRLAKLTRQNVLSIRAQPDRSRAELAEQFGVSSTTIYDIRVRKSWKYL